MAPYRAIAAVSVMLVIIGFHPIEAGGDARFRVRLDLVQAGPPVPSARCAPEVEVSLAGSGNGTRLGRVDAAGSHCIVDDPDDEDFRNGILTLTNGRGQVFITYEGIDAAGSLSGTFVITGGTGAYAGASGGGTLTGEGTTDGIGSVVLDGRWTF